MDEDQEYLLHLSINKREKIFKLVEIINSMIINNTKESEIEFTKMLLRQTINEFREIKKKIDNKT